MLCYSNHVYVSYAIKQCFLRQKVLFFCVLLFYFCRWLLWCLYAVLFKSFLCLLCYKTVFSTAEGIVLLSPILPLLSLVTLVFLCCVIQIMFMFAML